MTNLQGILKILKTATINDIQTGTFYIQDINYKIERNLRSDSWTFTNLENALIPGKEVESFTAYAISFNHDLPVTNLINEVGIIEFITYLNSLEFKDSRFNQIEDSTRLFTKNVRKSSRVFSPFNAGKVKPLKAMPKKWTLTHVKKAILNGQYKDLRCTGTYSDDYAYDAAYNYQIGDLNGIDFIKDIIESPSGWWTSERNGVVSICCHSFDSNEFTPVII